MIQKTSKVVEKTYLTVQQTFVSVEKKMKGVDLLKIRIKKNNVIDLETMSQLVFHTLTYKNEIRTRIPFFVRKCRSISKKYR